MIDLHPLCTFFPRLEGEDYLNLKSDILDNGQLEPIYTYQGMILDGGNRYKVLLECGIEPRIQEYNGDDPISFVLSKNLHRRHLKPSQAAAIVSAVQDWGKAHPQGRKETGKFTGLTTVADRTAQSGASDKTQRIADKIAKESPDLIKRVAHGEMSLGQAEALLHPKEPPKEPEIEPEDAPDLAAELEQAHKEIQTLQAAMGKDQAQVVKEWAEKYSRLESRLNSLMTEKAEAIKQATWYKRVLDQCVKLIGAESIKDLPNEIKLIVGK